MKLSIAVGGVALGLLLAAARPASAQMVQAGVVVRSGPVSGHVIVGEPALVVYREPVRRVVVVNRHAPRVIVVESVGGPRGRAYGWWRHRYRPVVAYYDGDRYYDRWFGGRPGLRQVEVYERNGRHYRWDGDRERYRSRDDGSRNRDDHRGRHDWDD